ncbi:MAG: hypothetical protein LBR16_06445 [Treponema sp.]|jgi:hypothetical protein|nr:hypothetical protein [Treponema sp.]
MKKTIRCAALFVLALFAFASCEQSESPLSDPPRSTRPQVFSNTVVKQSPVQQDVAFVLKGTFAGVWTVYDKDGAELPVLAYTEAFQQWTLLHLYDPAGDLAAGDYWVALTEEGCSESDAIKLTVQAYPYSTGSGPSGPAEGDDSDSQGDGQQSGNGEPQAGSTVYTIQSWDSTSPSSETTNFLCDASGVLGVSSTGTDYAKWKIATYQSKKLLKNVGSGNYINVKNLTPDWSTNALVSAFVDDPGFYWNFDETANPTTIVLTSNTSAFLSKETEHLETGYAGKVQWRADGVAAYNSAKWHFWPEE